MKKMGGRGGVAEGRTLEINCVDTVIMRAGVKGLERKCTHSSQKEGLSGPPAWGTIWPGVVESIPQSEVRPLLVFQPWGGKLWQ